MEKLKIPKLPETKMDKTRVLSAVPLFPEIQTWLRSELQL
jgi:hypothetical protein